MENQDDNDVLSSEHWIADVQRCCDEQKEMNDKVAEMEAMLTIHNTWLQQMQGMCERAIQRYAAFFNKQQS